MEGEEAGAGEGGAEDGLLLGEGRTKERREEIYKGMKRKKGQQESYITPLNVLLSQMANSHRQKDTRQRTTSTLFVFYTGFFPPQIYLDLLTS